MLEGPGIAVTLGLAGRCLCGAGLELVGRWVAAFGASGAPGSSAVGLECWRLVGWGWSAMAGPYVAPGYASRCGVGALLPHLGAILAHRRSYVGPS